MLRAVARIPADRLSIAQVTPHHWGQRHEINEFVERTSIELAERGHRVVDRRAVRPAVAASVRHGG